MEISYSLCGEQTIWGGMRWNDLTEKRLNDTRCLERYGYKVYSQNDEDGIIQEIFRRIGVSNKIFVEFGVQDGLESNAHYLLFQEWKGLWIEGSEQCIEDMQQKFYPLLQSGQLKCKCAFITKDNINDLIGEAGISGEIDLLSIDIDGNDFYVWEAINVINPRVVIIEYNGKFPPDCDWKMAYNENHIWDGSDWHGASLKAMEKLGRTLGYQLVGTNINGANAFFVRKDLANGNFFEPATAEELYNPSRFNIKHRSGHPARYCLKGQKENLGILNYMPNDIAISGYGFHDLEHDAEQYYKWSSERVSQILVRCDEEHRVVKIPYFLPQEVLEKENPYLLGITVNRKKVKEVQLVQLKGEVEVEIPAVKRNLVEIGIETPVLWRPYDLLNINDKRELGIAIVFSGIRTE